MSKSIFYFSAVKQHSNAGDALINRQLLLLLRAKGQVLAMHGGAPENFIVEVGLRPEELFRGSVAAFLSKAVRDRSRGMNVFLVQAPGDMPGAPVTANSIARTMVTIGLSVIGVNIIQFGVSLGRLTPGQARLLVWRTKYMRFLGLRDPISIATADAKGLKNFHPFPDLAFGIGVKPRKSENVQLHIGLSFRSDQLSAVEQESLVVSVRESLSTFQSKPQLTIATQVEKDQAFAHILLTSLADWNPVYEHSLSINALEAIYSRVDVVLSNRLHVLLLAGLSGSLPIAYVKERDNAKVIGLFNGLGLRELVFDSTHPVNLEEILTRRAYLGSRFVLAASNANELLKRTFAVAVDETR